MPLSESVFFLKLPSFYIPKKMVIGLTGNPDLVVALVVFF